ncbi:ExbD/TolR family protein [Aliikangiella coralliicola]|uniref:Biopolymer transporter ExbD n=1 Tax=Aliikangiella coralliicola TaxID=2592383 RepID=A0A545U8U6_9GAMM|nr:biopolymer transporter ExbD [Aliikangiella coralliicola]TQV85878.1 biopolymer transporter ExbD [Aliikangiella coralliicola]
MKKRGLKHLQEAEELNITAFLNLMVILVPFLLITAVFSRMTVLELNLPALDAKAKPQEKVKLQLELVLRDQSFDIQDANLGVIKKFARTKGETRWDLFTDSLVEIKSRFPEEDSITLLLEPSIDYKTMIKVMDRVRSADVVSALSVETVILFPNISIGDAPPVVTDSQTESGQK